MKKLNSNHVAIITGASKGIGKAIAIEFARNGVQVVLAARSTDDLARVQREIEQGGGSAVSIPTDVTSPQAVQALSEAALERFGRIDVLINNAGIGRVGRVEDPGFATDVLATMQASLLGMIAATQAVLPTMKEQHSGSIVNMSSVMGRKAFERFGSYAIVMHGVTALSDTLRQELYGTGINVTVVHPALTSTELLGHVSEGDMPAPFRFMTPLTPERVARGVYHAARRGQGRLVVPATANMLLLAEALSPLLGDNVARQLARGTLPRLLGMSSGNTYHDVLRRNAAQGAG